MSKNCLFAFFVILLPYVAKGAPECVNVATSEGETTLQNGQTACAPLESGETNEDKGKRYVICNHGSVVIQPCPTGLRYDVQSRVCNWPRSGSCTIEGGSNTASATSTTTKSVSQTTPRLTPSPQPSQPPPEGPCNATNCRLPNCFCFGNQPSSVPLADTPMFIMTTFDDHVSTYNYDKYYKTLVKDNIYNLTNPNGCPAKYAFYVNHDNTDYSKVKALWDAGNEIGSHTYHHRLPQGDKDSDYPEMVSEIIGIKDEILRQTGSKALVDSMKGFRSPYLRVAGDVQYDVLYDYSFVYDTSILNINILQGRDPIWPFTFDFLIGECVNPPCPSKPYPGLWEVPLNGFVGDNGQGCSMADDCVVGSSSWLATEDQWYNYYKRHFDNKFYPIKVPMNFFIHATLFENYPRSYTALVRCLQDILASHTDVWLVTPSQVIQWMQNPLTNQNMISQKWGC